MILRATGWVTEAGVRSVTRKADGAQFAIPTVTLRVNDFVVLDVTGPESFVQSLSVGDFVDLIVEVSASGGVPRARATGASWPRESSLHSVVAAS